MNIRLMTIRLESYTDCVEQNIIPILFNRNLLFPLFYSIHRNNSYIGIRRHPWRFPAVCHRQLSSAEADEPR